MSQNDYADDFLQSVPGNFPDRFDMESQQIEQFLNDENEQYSKLQSQQIEQPILNDENGQHFKFSSQQIGQFILNDENGHEHPSRMQELISQNKNQNLVTQQQIQFVNVSQVIRSHQNDNSSSTNSQRIQKKIYDGKNFLNFLKSQLNRFSLPTDLEKDQRMVDDFINTPRKMNLDRMILKGSQNLIIFMIKFFKGMKLQIQIAKCSRIKSKLSVFKKHIRKILMKLQKRYREQSQICPGEKHLKIAYDLYGL